MMETLIMSASSSSHPLLLQSSKNRAFYPFIPSSSSSSLLPSTKKPDFVSFHHKHNYNSVSLQLKAEVSSVSCKSSASDQSSFDPQSENNAGSTNIPSHETLKSKTVRVEFQVIRECLFGQEFLVVGDDPILGVWDPSKALPLKWSQGHIWTAEVDFPIEKTIQFLFILKDPTGEFVGQPGPHRVFQTRAQTNKMVVIESWDFEGHQRTSEEEPLAKSNTLEDVTAQSKTVKVKFQLKSQCLVGQEYLVIGDDPILGGWNPSGAIPLKWSLGLNGYDLWTSAMLDMPIGKTVQFRFMLKDATTGEVIKWQAGRNTAFTPHEIDADQNFMVGIESIYVVNTKNYEAKSTEVPRSRPDPFKDENYDLKSFFDGLFKD